MESIACHLDSNERDQTNVLSTDQVLTLRLFQLLNEELDRVFRLVDNQGAHHVLKDFVEALLLDVFFTAALEVNLLLFQHHLYCRCLCLF